MNKAVGYRMHRYVAGCMSGTSLDGLDVAICKIDGHGPDTQVELLGFISRPFDPGLREDIIACIEGRHPHARRICSTNFKLGIFTADTIEMCCKRIHFDMADLSLIGSHGQTIYHIPDDTGEDDTPSTLQIGEPAVIASRCNATVVSSFRSMDMAVSGKGAPLVPYAEYLIYQKDYGRALQNIGGIGNVTVLPAGGTLDDVFAFDTGPGNMIIDDIAQRLFHKPYDTDGFFASRGTVNHTILDQLMQMPFFDMTPPRATGRELFGTHFTDYFLQLCAHMDWYDIIATATALTAKSIVHAIDRFVLDKVSINELIVSGGGAHNKTLLSMLSSDHGSYRILTQEDIGYSSDAKEAIAFAILANQTIHLLPSNIPAVTGATKPVILGNVTYV